jgi:hypothetical protein
LPLESRDAIFVAPYLKYNLPPDSTTENAAVTRFVAFVALVELVAVAALPVTLIAHVPEAPVPVGEGTSAPIARPRFVRALLAEDAPVPPSAIAKSVASVNEERWLFWKTKAVPLVQTVTVLPVGIATPAPAAVVLPSTVEL